MYKSPSAKYYQENKEKLQKKASERYESLCEEGKKCKNMVLNYTKIFHKMKKINWLTIEKKCYKC